jgi:hypothetical protein
MIKVKCSCGKTNRIFVQPWQRKAIRAFKAKYPWVANDDIATLFNLSTTRISEIIRADIEKRGA